MNYASSRLHALMKKILLLSTLVGFATICSCQKQDSATEAQLAQRKTELDARETALDQREKAVEVRERALAARENPSANISTIQPETQSLRQTTNAAEAKTETERRLQQLPPEVRALIPETSQQTAESRSRKRDPADPANAQAERQLRPEDLDRQWQRKLDKAKISGGAFAPTTKSAETDATSPSPSATPQ
jgi:hypothetical protein